MRVKVKQNTRKWETLRETRIGSSEVFDIVRYYATDTELQNCGINAEKFKEEQPFVSAWSLYHKMLNDGLYQRPLLAPELADYGKAMEIYGHKVFTAARQQKVRRGDVYVKDRLIASLDMSGVSESVDCKAAYDYGEGSVKAGLKFVGEQKTLSPYKDSIPLKYLIQAQYQVLMSHSDFFILQVMLLKNDTPFERGIITSLANTSRKKFLEYVEKNAEVQTLYFKNNEALSALILLCLKRFFDAVEAREEPVPYLQTDKQRDILIAIRDNTFYIKDKVYPLDLSDYVDAQNKLKKAEENKKEEMQKIIELAQKNHCSRFSGGGFFGAFSVDGKFLVREEK